MRFRERHHHRRRPLEIRALLRAVVGDENQALADGNQEGIGGGFERVQCLAIIGIGQLEAERARRLIIGVEQHFEVQRGGHLFPKRLGVALEVVIATAGLGLAAGPAAKACAPLPVPRR